MQDVARAANMHVSTVSLALRNSPRLAADTRERIRKLADRMGYRPNPLVVAFVQRRRASKKANFQGTLAFVTRFPGKSAAMRASYSRPSLEGAEERAEELGFRFDTFELSDYENNPGKLQRVFRARNIHGMILAPLPKQAGMLDFDWQHLAAVAVGPELSRPVLDRVDYNRYQAMQMALAECERRGYRRAAFISLPISDHRTHGDARGGFLAYVPEQRSLRLLPPLVVESKEIPARIGTWWKRWKPDVLLAKDAVFGRALPILKECGWEAGRDFGMVQLNIAKETNTMSGCLISPHLLGRLAVDFLAGKLYRNEVGLPKVPQLILAPAQWHEGSSLPWRKPPGQFTA